MKTLALVPLLLLGPLPAAAVPPDLDDARDAHAAAVQRARALANRAIALTRAYERLEADAGRATAVLIDALREELRVEAELAESRALLARRANAAYRAGPGTFAAVVLESSSPADFLAATELIERAIYDGVRDAASVLETVGDVRGDRLELERRKRALLRGQRGLASLRARAEERLRRARAAARAAGVRLEALEAASRRVADSAVAGGRAIDALAGVDQGQLLALLGPSGGRGCEVPEGLRGTGRTFEGTASWYGWGWAGNPTATGAIYDPRLFTAAHKTLPLNSFLRVQTGGTCAILLVNDRGPYHSDWVLDLSLAAAEHLGYERAGTAHVVAEILEPAASG